MDEMTEWQKIRFGDTPQARAALAFWRARNWLVDDQRLSRDVEDRIYAFISGYEAALSHKPAQRPPKVTDEMVELAEVVWDTHDMRKALEAAFSLVRETQPVQPDPLAGTPDGLVG